jgi:hypothetical protein
MPRAYSLNIEVTLNEDRPDRTRFSTFCHNQGSQSHVLRVLRDDCEETRLKIKPMESPELDQLMSVILTKNIFSPELEQALSELAEGFFQAGIEYANRKGD